MNEDQKEYYEERAAIYEYCAGMSKSDAEKKATDDMKHRYEKRDRENREG